MWGIAGIAALLVILEAKGITNVTGLIGQGFTPRPTANHVHQTDTNRFDELIKDLMYHLDNEQTKERRRQDAQKILEALRKARSESPKP